MFQSAIVEPNDDGRGMLVQIFVIEIAGWDDIVPWSLVTLTEECGN